MNVFKIFALVVISLASISCSSDDEGSSENLDFGNFELSVTGDFTQETNGFADFDSLSAFGVNSWEISMNDINPSTVSLQLSLVSSTGEVSQPSPGTYEIGFDANSSDVFSAIYVHIPDGNFFETVEYTTFSTADQAYGGSLIIETSNANVVSGSFNFTAAKVDDDFNVIGEIAVSGEFNARKRMN